MLEPTHPRSSAPPPKRFAGGAVDVVLAILMLPFGIAMWVIEGMARGISSLSSK